MPSRHQALNARQLEVLSWLADGCPDHDWSDQSYKHSARALHDRGLAKITRRNKVWTASITDKGRYYLEHGRFPSAPAVHTADSKTAGGRLAPTMHRADGPPLDATARAMQRVARRAKPSTIKRTAREIKETYMRYKVVVTRVQVAERFVRAPSEEEAAAKVQQEFDRPYGYFGSWKTTSSEVDVVEAEQTTVIGPTHLSPDGPMLLSIKDAAKALGISYSTLYQMTSKGDIEHVAVGSRKFISREKLKTFIDQNTHQGYYLAR
ncbi:helix-turn-helix domain-containing protein [Saccharopolyspora sp. NPDC003762]